MYLFSAGRKKILAGFGFILGFGCRARRAACIVGSALQGPLVVPSLDRSYSSRDTVIPLYRLPILSTCCTVTLPIATIIGLYLN